MPNYTKTINLEKPLQTEIYDVDKRNANWDKIDKAIKKTEMMQILMPQIPTPTQMG